MRRWRWSWLVCLLLGGCMQGGQEVPDDLLQHLTGRWQSQQGDSAITFYADLSVKLLLTLPDQRLSARLLSTVEMMQDGAIGISLGDRWRGPARITMDSTASNRLVFHLPGDKKDQETLLYFTKQ
ncbi:MAG: hypothetical protein Q9M13_02410 [Mariprofundales bacterium]|nr:hypothetical protein [Mariprofundales bacterium]